MNDQVLLELRSFGSLQTGDSRPQLLRTRHGAFHYFSGGTAHLLHEGKTAVLEEGLVAREEGEHSDTRFTEHKESRSQQSRLAKPHTPTCKSRSLDSE